MRVGIDTFTIRELNLDPIGRLDWIHAHGFEGAQFGPFGADVAKLREIRDHADRLGLYSHTSVASPNLALTGEDRAQAIDARSVAIRAAAEVGWHELHSTLGNEKTRYEHDVPWSEQLSISADTLSALGPVLRDCGSRVDIETHGEATTFELARLCEEVGPDICGICLDTANVLVFAEDPVAAVRRAAPYTHLTHTKDAILFFSDRGLVRQVRPPGQGVIDWEEVLPILHRYEPNLPLSIEDHKWLFEVPIFSSAWHAEQADLSREELAEVVRIAWTCRLRINEGELPEPEAYESIPFLDQMESRLAVAREHLQSIIREKGLE